MISDYMTRAGRWAWLLLVLPVICAGAAVGLNYQTAGLWSGAADILTAPSITSRSGAQYVNDLQAVLLSHALVAQVAKQTGITSSTVSSGLTSAVLASGSSLIQVTFTSAHQAQADSVPAVAARLAIQSLLRPGVAADLASLNGAETQSQRAIRARDAYTIHTGVQLPVQSYQAGLAEVAQLRANTETARIEGRDPTGGLTALLNERTAAVAELAPQVVQYQALQAEVDSTYQDLNQARAQLATAQADLAAVKSPKSIISAGAVQQANSQRLIQLALSGAVVGVLCAVLILVGILTLSRRRRRTLSQDVRSAVDGVSGDGGQTTHVSTALDDLRDAREPADGKA